jgi:tetratricopeptide (TPR) repeat protein
MSEDREDREYEFSEGQGFDDPYEGFDIDPPELDVDPDAVDPVDSRVLSDLLDERQLPSDQVDAEQLLEVGIEYTRINRYEQATEALQRAAQYAERERIQQEAWVNKGAAHAELEEYDAAIGAYREAIDIDDDSEHAATAHTNLAFALWESGRSEQALEHAERAVEIDERFGQAWYNRGFFLLERGLAEDAVDAFDNAIRLGMRSAMVLEEKARALEELGEYDEAEELADRAKELREEAEQELVDHGQSGPR